MRTKRTKVFYSNRGHVQGQGSSKSEANAQRDLMTDWLCSQSGVFSESRYGAVIIVAACPSGFETKVIFADDIASHGKRHWFSSYGNHLTDVKTVIMAARLHAAQTAWTPETDDTQHVAMSGLENTRDLESWIRFQRSYIAHRASGLTDGEAHRLACAA